LAFLPVFSCLLPVLFNLFKALSIQFFPIPERLIVFRLHPPRESAIRLAAQPLRRIAGISVVQ